VAQRWPVLLFALIMAALPFVPGLPPFWLVLLDNIGLAALVAIGLVILTGVGGLTSFGQAAFCGFGAYTTAVLTTSYGISPWLTLPASLIVSGAVAVVLGIVTVRLSGHYLPLGTIAWGISLYYIFGKVELLGRNDGISGIPPLVIGQLNHLAGRDRRGPADDELARLANRPRRSCAAARPCGGGSVRRADGEDEAARVHSCGRARRPVRVALCAFPAVRESDPVRPECRH
jgi:ABC-type branched-subunit amino acid transport system permease subunit